MPHVNTLAALRFILPCARMVEKWLCQWISGDIKETCWLPADSAEQPFPDQQIAVTVCMPYLCAHQKVGMCSDAPRQ